MDLYSVKNKIYEIRSYIASDWPSIEERQLLYKELHRLENIFEEIKNEQENDKPKEN